MLRRLSHTKVSNAAIPLAALLSILALICSPHVSTGSLALREGDLPPVSSPLPTEVDTGKAGNQPGLSQTPFQSPSPFDTSRTSTPADSIRKAKVDSTLKARADSTLGAKKKLDISDSSYVVCYDSTARLKFFSHVRTDKPAVELFPRRTHPLYAAVPPAYRREGVLDSTGSMMKFREYVAGENVKIPVGDSLMRYLARRRAHDLRRMFADEARKPKVVEQKDDLGQVLSNITKISIPVPPNPIFSIFGKSEINLNITGAVDIKAGFRNIKSDQQTANILDQTRNEPDFAQEVQVNVNGTIGDKLNILADWNTQRTFEYENQLKIKYTGYDDEIVQSVEAGNVSLQTPSSFIGSSAALFGIKAKFQTGPLTLTTLASQKKGQIKEVNVSGGAQEQPFEIQAHNFATNHYFVDSAYRRSYESYYQNEPPTVTQEMQDSKIVEAEVWIMKTGNVLDPTQRHGIAFISLPERQGGYPTELQSVIDTAGSVETGEFVKLDPGQYELGGDGYTGVLSLNQNVRDELIIAIAYRTADGKQFGDLTRNTTDTSRGLILKMVKPKNLLAVGPGYPKAWAQLLKNIYTLGTRNLKKEGFVLNIFRRVNGAEDQDNVEGEPLLRILGVDKYNVDGTPTTTGDKIFDFRVGRSINPARSEIIFPYLRPFDEGVFRYFRDVKNQNLPDTSELRFKEVYDTTRTFAQQSIRNRYILKGKATGEATSKYNLGFNIVEGSVRVFLNGAQLTQNLDYTVDYILGEVVIRNDRALVPGANLQIKFEQNDLFQLASKTLLGARADVALSPKTNLGFTMMNLNQQTLSDKVRLGEEPSKNTIYGFDGQTEFNLPFLTKAIDAIPLLQTKEQSQLKLSGEAAYMSPDPNTKKSTIPSDGGQGIAYIDDFEGARRTIPVGINFAQWTAASPPSDSASVAAFGGLDTAKMFSKAKMIWFNRLPTDVALTQIYYNKFPGNAANDQATVLDFRYFPDKRGMYNYAPRDTLPLYLRSGPGRAPRNWGGVMKTLSISGINLIDENIKFIELWMRVDRNPSYKFPGDTTAKMYIDIGGISENVIPSPSPDPQDRVRHTEDRVLSNSIIDGVLQPGEDIGLDMLVDGGELARYGDLNGDGDPSGDNYAFDNSKVGTAQEDYTRINGTEGNANGPGGRIPDTEDINNNGIVDAINSYNEYELPLDTAASRNPYIVGGGKNGWWQFRIPITDVKRSVGTPSTTAEYIRVFFRNATDTIAVRIADFTLLGNQWRDERAVQDSSFAIGTVSVEDNPDYTSPPGVIREQDKTRPNEKVLANEQSLALLLKGVPPGQSRQAVKHFDYRPLDVFNYRTMKMFVHGDLAFGYRGLNDYDAEVYFRFGSDSLTWYEYRAPIRVGWDNDITVNFDELTAIKQDRDSVNVVSNPRPLKSGPPGAVYRVLGNPSLTQIRYMAIGVTNRSNRVLVGQVWANELRLTSVDDSPGWAYRVDAQLKMADLAAVSVNYSRVDPNFHTLEQRFGSRQTGINWGLNASMSLERFFPVDWVGTSIPISYSHAVNLVQPKYLPNSDVLVSEAANLQRDRVLRKGGSQAEADATAAEIELNAETYRVTDTYAAPNFKIGFPSQAWYIRDTFNKLSLGFNYTRSTERSPQVTSRVSWQWNAKLQYALNFSPDYYFMPFNDLFDGLWLLDEYKSLKLFFAPTSFSWSLGLARTRDRSLQRVQGAQEIISRNFSASRSMSLGWKLSEGGLMNLSGDYNLSIESSLLTFELDQRQKQRSFSAMLGDIFFSDRLINFGQDTRYSQRNQFNSKPSIPNIFNIKKYLDLSLGYGVDYSWQNMLQNGDLGKSVGFSNNITASVNFKLKQLFDPLFESQPSAPPQEVRGRGRGREEGEVEAPKDTTRSTDTTRVVGGKSGLDRTLDQLKNLTKMLIKTPFLDYDNININFTQTNSATNSGVVGRPGFVNFWGRLPFFQEADPKYGPSRLYQLGLISDPSGRLTGFGARSKFPFFGWEVEQGIRAPNGVLQNSYRQQNRLALKTSRNLWEGARLDLNWNVGWSYNRTQDILSDSLGIPTIRNTSTQGSVDRSFMTFPDVLFLGAFKSSLKDVAKKYQELKANRADTSADEEKLSQAFEQGFEALPIFRKIFGQFFPRVNWTLRWDGLEKLSIFSGFVSRLSLDHAYTSNYTRQYEQTAGLSNERTTGQRVTYGFSPLVGLNFTFKELLKGSFGANLRYNTNTSFDLVSSSKNLVEALAQELSVTASYSRRGFEIPLFGVSLNNDIDISASYSVTKNARTIYEVAMLDVNQQGIPQEGSTRTVMEPRIKYVLSSRVTASIYYRYTKVAPDATGSRIPGTTTNEAGLDVHISIQ